MNWIVQWGFGLSCPCKWPFFVSFNLMTFLCVFIYSNYLEIWGNIAHNLSHVTTTVMCKEFVGNIRSATVPVPLRPGFLDRIYILLLTVCVAPINIWRLEHPCKSMYPYAHVCYWSRLQCITYNTSTDYRDACLCPGSVLALQSSPVCYILIVDSIYITIIGFCAVKTRWWQLSSKGSKVVLTAKNLNFQAICTKV